MTSLFALLLTPPTGATLITEAYSGLRASPALFLGVEAQEQIGTRRGITRSALYFQGGNLWSLELLEEANNVLQRRSVGDGTTFSTWRPGLNEYMSSVYGSWSGNLPENYRNNLLQAVSQVTSGPATYLTRLLREIVGGEYSEFRAWIPGASEYVLQQGNQPVTDPITSRRFLPGQDVEFVGYELGTPVRRTVVFERTRVQGVWTLSHIYLGEVSTSGNQPRTLDWVFSATAEAVSSGNFQFRAPAGAKAVPFGKSFRG